MKGFIECENLGLLEIDSKQQPSHRESEKSGRSDYRSWLATTQDCCENKAIDELKRRMGITEIPGWFWKRCNEHIQTSYSIHDVQIDRKEVLDVGAASGFDSLKFFKYSSTLSLRNIGTAETQWELS